MDVGQALEVMVDNDLTASQTYELYGPTNYSMYEIGELVDKEIIKKRRHINVPKTLLKPAADILNKVLYWHTTSGDEIEREFIDQTIDRDAKTFKDLGIEPAELKGLTFHYLVSSQVAAFTSVTSADSPLARLPELVILRFTTGYGAGEARGEEVLACY